MGQSSDVYNKKDSDSRFAQASALDKYYTKPESDVRFAPAQALQNYYTKPESDIRFAPAPALKNYYTKPEIDSRFAPAPDLSNYYTKPESNSRFAPAQALNAIDNTIGSIQGAITGINNTIGSLQRVYDNRYVPTSALTSINNTIGSMQGSLISINNTIGSIQGAITGINNTIGSLQRVYDNRYVQSSTLQNFYNKNDSDKRFAPASVMNNVNTILSNNIARLQFMSAKERSLAPAGAPVSFTSCMSSNTLNVNGFEDETKVISGAKFVTCGANNIWTMTFDFKRLRRHPNMFNIIAKYTSAPQNNLDCEQRTPVVAVTNGETIGFRYSYGNNSRDAQCGLGIPNVNLPWDNDWHNIIWQQNGRNIQIYLDGRRVVNHTLPADPVTFDPTRDMTLGTDNLNSIKNFNYVPAYLLTANEIAAIAFNRNF